MNCPKCGLSLPVDSEFCQYCGVKFGEPQPSFASEEGAVAPVENSEPLPTETLEPVVTDGAVVTIPLDSVQQAESFSVVPTAKSRSSEKVPKKQVYCKKCGSPIEATTKKCTGCGKQYFNVKIFPLLCIFVLFLSIVGYVVVNYFCAVSAMNNQEFIKSQQFFDNLFVSKAVFPNKYAYVKAGVLMEEGKYVASLDAFEKLVDTPIPATITDSLKSKIYSAGQTAYRAGDIAEARINFLAISQYKRSDDYLFLCRYNNYGSILSSSYDKLVALLGFENVAEIIMSDQSTAIKFLNGRWESGSYYFEIKDENNTSTYNLPHKYVDGYYCIDNGVYSVETTKYFKFSIINEDTLSIYCYKDGSTHTLYRQ